LIRICFGSEFSKSSENPWPVGFDESDIPELDNSCTVLVRVNTVMFASTYVIACSVQKICNIALSDKNIFIHQLYLFVVFFGVSSLSRANRCLKIYLWT